MINELTSLVLSAGLSLSPSSKQDTTITRQEINPWVTRYLIKKYERDNLFHVDGFDTTRDEYMIRTWSQEFDSLGSNKSKQSRQVETVSRIMGIFNAIGIDDTTQQKELIVKYLREYASNPDSIQASCLFPEVRNGVIIGWGYKQSGKEGFIPNLIGDNNHIQIFNNDNGKKPEIHYFRIPYQIAEDAWKRYKYGLEKRLQGDKTLCLGSVGGELITDPNGNMWYGGSLDLDFSKFSLRLAVDYGSNPGSSFTEIWGEKDQYGIQGYNSVDRKTENSSGTASLMLVKPASKKIDVGLGPLVYTQQEDVKDRVRERLYRNGRVIGVEPSYYTTSHNNYTRGGLRASADFNVLKNIALTGGADFVKGHSPKYMIGGRVRR